MELHLKELRKRIGLTQQDLADKVGATKRQIGAWERGENDIPMDFAVAIADVLGCSVDEIAGRSRTATVLVLDLDERELIQFFRNMDDSQKKILLDTARNFAVATKKDGRYAEEIVGIRAVDAVRK